jgi:hypothetical protein
MPRCVDCANYRKKDGFCSWCNAYITRKSAEKSLRCDGFTRRKSSRGKLEKVLEVK